MRKVIIDTDAGSDDAVAIIMCLRDPAVDVLAITTVSGNVDVDQGTLNALMSAEIALGAKNCPPIYKGADRPLMRERVHARNVHGNDGMSDLGLVHPSIKEVEGVVACDAIIDLVKKNPGEIELAVIGPATNVALAMMKDPKTMKQLKCIWVMGTAGFGPGNMTPVSEYNVFADAEAYKIMMDFGVHIYVGGFDITTNDTCWVDEDLEDLLSSGKEAAVFSVRSNELLGKFSYENSGVRRINLCDAISLAPMLWEDVALEKRECISHVVTDNKECYGQVIFYDGGMLAGMGPSFENNYYGKSKANCTVFTKIDAALYKNRLAAILKQ